MRATPLLTIAAVASLIGVAAVGAEPAGPPPAADAAACAGRQDVLGVSRVVEIDPTGGPEFGEQGHEPAFLQPGEVVLTFDDGPLRHNTHRVLAALDAECTKATFFSVGKMALADPEMVREAERRGHTIGSHTWSHRNLGRMPATLATQEVELGISAVSKALGHPAAPFFRFPYLSQSKAMLAHNQGRNVAMFSIDVDAVDYRTHDPAVVQRRVLAGLKSHGGGIILFHDIQVSTAGALRGLLAEMRAQGYRVVHIVPKAPVTTLPEYDAQADRELSRRKVAAAANPLATRSVVWPNTGGDSLPEGAEAAEPAPAAPVKPAEPVHHRAASASAGMEESARISGVPPPGSLRVTPRRQARPEDSDSWTTWIFKN
jgi:peptidoglycan-N-acetylglucosamine deacetylase